MRILVVDDTALYRKLVSEALREVPGVEVVGTAIDGRLALDKITELAPDLVTLDLMMPNVDGVAVLKRLQSAPNPPGVIVLSALTSDGAAATTEALRLGAFDFVLKPSGVSSQANMEEMRRKLSECVAAFATSRGKTLPARPEVAKPTVVPPVKKPPRRADQAELIVLGISTGGPEALSKLIPRLPGDLAAPLLIVQHMPPIFTRSLADDLHQRSKLNVCEARDGQLAQPGDCLIAPGGKQMKVERTPLGPVVRITEDHPENSCRPAVDYLFRSAAHHYGGRVLAVIMTGMGSDGLIGCRLLKRHGAAVIAQDKATSVVFGMPGAIVEHELADVIAPLGEIAGHILAGVGQGVAV
jgi:two-component system chemotaxis response regulator CheB